MKTCKICGDGLQNNRYTFCSIECKRKALEISCICETCGSSFTSSVHKTTRFCSKSCQSNNKTVKEKAAESLKRSCLERYGVEAYTQTEEFKKKSKETHLSRYGVEHAQQSKDIRNKAVNTCLEKYGVDNVAKSEFSKEKAKQTSLDLYGVEHYTKLKESIEHGKRVKKERYGDENYNNLEKSKTTCLEKYGVDNVSKLQSVKDKISNNHIQIYLDSVFEGDRLKNKVKPLFNRNEYIGSGVNYKFECLKCNTIFDDHISDGHIPRCPSCYPLVNSLGEMELFEYIKSITRCDIQSNVRNLLSSCLELDIYLPDKKLAFEYNGLYWHSEVSGGKDKNYHLNKSNRFSEIGVRVIHIFESEWFNKQDIVKSMVGMVLHNSNINKIYARNCEIVEVSNSEKERFMVDNHIQGDDRSSVRLGLKHNNVLVSMMTFIKSRFDKSVEFEMSRFCNKTFTSVVGGANKLFQHFLRTNKPKSVVTYCDKRLFTGKVYENLGFSKLKDTPPNYYYTRHKTLQNRISFQKHKLSKILEIFDPNLSEWENMKNNGYDRIWDCGNMKFIWKSE